MHFYRVLYEGPADSKPSDYSHHGSLAGAHLSAKGYSYAEGVRVELIDVATDKASILDLLMGYDPTGDDIPAVRTWKLGARGGLVEVKNGE